MLSLKICDALLGRDLAVLIEKTIAKTLSEKEKRLKLGTLFGLLISINH